MSQRVWYVRDFQQGDEIQILKLFKKVFGYERSLEHWRWKFEQNPAGRQITVAVTAEGTMVGHFAGLPVFATTPTGAFLVSQGVDHMVDPEWQRQGMYKAMAQHFLQNHIRKGKAVGLYTFPVQGGFEIEVKAFGPQALHKVPLLSWGLSDSESWQSQSDDLQLYQVETVDRADTSVDELWNLCRPELTLATKRDSQYLNWRYADCPDIEYTILLARGRSGGRPLGLVVLRHGWLGQPVTPIVDWLVPAKRTDVGRALLAACHDLGRKKKMTAMHASFPDNTPQYRFFVELGYRPSFSRFILAAICPEGSEVSKPLKEGWYYTMGDSDMY